MPHESVSLLLFLLQPHPQPSVASSIQKETFSSEANSRLMYGSGSGLEKLGYIACTYVCEADHGMKMEGKGKEGTDIYPFAVHCHSSSSFLSLLPVNESIKAMSERA